MFFHVLVTCASLTLFVMCHVSCVMCRCGIVNSFFFTQLSDNGKGYRFQGVKRFLKRAKVNGITVDRFLWLGLRRLKMEKVDVEG